MASTSSTAGPQGPKMERLIKGGCPAHYDREEHLQHCGRVEHQQLGPIAQHPALNPPQGGVQHRVIPKEQRVKQERLPVWHQQKSQHAAHAIHAKAPGKAGLHHHGDRAGTRQPPAGQRWPQAPPPPKASPPARAPPSHRRKPLSWNFSRNQLQLLSRPAQQQEIRSPPMHSQQQSAQIREEHRSQELHPPAFIFVLGR